MLPKPELDGNLSCWASHPKLPHCVPSHSAAGVHPRQQTARVDSMINSGRDNRCQTSANPQHLSSREPNGGVPHPTLGGSCRRPKRGSKSANRFYGLVPAFGLTLAWAAIYRWIIEVQPEPRRKKQHKIAATPAARTIAKVRGKLLVIKAGSL